MNAPSTDFDGRARPGDGNGDGVAAFDIGAFEFGRDLTISPPSGAFVRTQRFDLVVVVEDRGSAVGGAVSLDGLDITAAFVACAVAGRAAPSGLTLRCPGVPMALLSPAVHALGVRIDYSDGSSERRTVLWDVRQNAEP